MREQLYMYEIQKARYNNYYKNSLYLRKNLKCDSYDNIIALPPQPSKKFIGDGGLIDKNHNNIELSYVYGYNNSKYIGDPYTINDDEIENELDGEYIYLGFMHHHWGHFIVDFCTRLYYTLQSSVKNYIFLLPFNIKLFKLSSPIRRFLELINIDIENIVFISKPTKIKSIIVPEPSYCRGTYYSQQYLDVFNIVANNIKPTAQTDFDKVYFSRAKYPKAVEKELGVELIDDLFHVMKYEVIYPEKESLDNQIYYINNCDEFAAISGTIIHNLIFSHRSYKNVYIVNKTYIINEAVLDTCKIKNLKPIFLDFYLSKYPVHIGFGPFIFYRNINFDKFIDSLFIDINTLHFCNTNNLINYISSYDQYYHRLLREKKHYVNVSDNPDSLVYFPPFFIKDWINNVYRYEDEANINYLKYNTISDIERENELLKNNISTLIKLDKEEVLLIYNTHLSMIGWIGDTITNTVSGAINKNHGIEAFYVYTKDNDLDLIYSVYYKDSGWSDEIKNGGIAGTVGKSKIINGIKIYINNDISNKYKSTSIVYRIYDDNWSKWYSDGEEAITNSIIKAIQIDIRHYDKDMKVGATLTDETRKKRIASIAAEFSPDKYDLFEELHYLTFDKSKKFPTYDPDKRVIASKTKLSSIINTYCDKKISSYLDIGCGMGFFPMAATTMGLQESMGIDLVEHESWKYYTSKNISDCSLKYLATDLSTSKSTYKFDLITSFAAFEHMQFPDKMLLSISDLLNPDGILYINFSPIWRSWGGPHLYRNIQIPWYHLLFSQKVIDKYYRNNNINQVYNDETKMLSIGRNKFNMLSALDFYTLFTYSKPDSLRLINIYPIVNRDYSWFIDLFKKYLPYPKSELLIDGFTVVYKKRR